jgi:hypothetical protein
LQAIPPMSAGRVSRSEKRLDSLNPESQCEQVKFFQAKPNHRWTQMNTVAPATKAWGIQRKEDETCNRYPVGKHSHPREVGSHSEANIA